MTQTEATIACSAKFAVGARQRLGDIITVFTRELGRAIEVRIQDAEGSAAAAEAETGSDAAGAGVASTAQQPVSPVEDPLVKLAAELFSARIVAITQRPPPHH